MNTEETTNETAGTEESSVEETTNATFDYSLDNVEPEQEDTAQDEQALDNKEPETEVEYKLELGEVDDEDKAYVDMMTVAAKNAGIDAKQASACFMEFTKALQQSHVDAAKAQHDALVKEWGRNFKTKVETTQKFMRKLFNEAGFSKEEMEQFATPAGIRLFSKLQSTLRTGRYAGASSQPIQTKSPKEQMEELMTKWAKIRYGGGSAADLESMRKQINALSTKQYGVPVV